MEGFKVVIVGGGSSHTPGIIQSLILIRIVWSWWIPCAVR